MKDKHTSPAAHLGDNYHNHILAACLIAAVAYIAIAFAQPQYMWIAASAAAFFTLLALFKIKPARAQSRFESQLVKTKKPWCTFADLIAVCRDTGHATDRWVGYGFEWEPSHRQITDAFLKEDWQRAYRRMMLHAKRCRYLRQHWKECLAHPIAAIRKLAAMKALVSLDRGHQWMHAIGREEPRYLTSDELKGHLLVVGTTGAGKSRFLDLQIAQTIMQGQTVIVIDPKGDKGTVENMKRACRIAGREKDFHFLHLARPEISEKFDLLANFSRVEELASRITDCLPGQGGEGQTFIDMGNAILRTIIAGLKYLGEKPTFKLLQYFYHNREELAEKALEAFLVAALSREAVIAALRDEGKRTRLEILSTLYRSQPSRSPEIESLLALAQRDVESLLKTTTSTLGLLERMATGDLGALLSPAPFEHNDAAFLDSRKLIERGGVLYIGLDALSDSAMTRAVGTMFLADLKATAGARYNFSDASRPIALFIDEACELACDPLIQLLNKSRGARFSLCLATQTIADFVSKLGNKAKADSTLGNLNNIVIFRCIDADTQKALAEKLPRTKLQTRVVSHGTSTTSSGILPQSGTVSERLSETDAELVPSALLGALPICEYYGLFGGSHLIKGRIPVLVESAKDFVEE